MPTVPTVRAMALPAPEPIILVQDNSPVHKSRGVDTWFSDHHEFVQLFWPARSPDLNPIENVWACMVNEWVHGNEKTQDALERHAKEAWESIRRNCNYCENLVRSMPRRIQQCREVDGGYTKY